MSTARVPGDPGGDISVKEMFLRIYRLFWNKRFGLMLIFAMALWTLFGVLFTQVDATAFADKERYASFLEQVRPKYGGWTPILSAAGMFHVFSSWPWLIITVLLVPSIIACTVHRLPQLWKNATAPHTHVREGFFEHSRTRRTVELSDDAESVALQAEQKLSRLGFRTIRDDRDGALNIYADKFRFFPLGTAVAHLAFVLIMLGALVTANTGFRNDEFTVPVGMGPQPVGHGTGLSVEAKSFTDSYHEDGRPMDYAADLVLYKDGQPVKQQLVRVNAPLTHDRVKFNQSYFGFAAEMTIADGNGTQLMHSAVPLQYSTEDKSQNYGKVDLPERNRQLFVVQPASGQVDAQIGPGQVMVELYDATSEEMVDRQILTQGQPLTVGDLKLTFQRERQFTGLMVSKDNGAPLVWTGAGLLVIGMVCTMLLRHQRLWLRIHPTPDGARLRVASPDRHDMLFEQKVTNLVDSIGEKLDDNTRSDRVPA